MAVGDKFDSLGAGDRRSPQERRPFVVNTTIHFATGWAAAFLKLMTLRRLRAQAIVLALCLWGVCAVDFATSGPFDRAGNIKFQDFLPFYVSAKLTAQQRAADMYNRTVQRQQVQEILHQPTQVEVPYLYVPQLTLIFLPLIRYSFATAAKIWTVLSLLIYFGCIYAIAKYCQTPSPSSGVFAGSENDWRSAGAPRICGHDEGSHGVHWTFEDSPRNRGLIFLAAFAFPPLFHLFVRGQISSLILLCFVLAFLAFSVKREFLAGVALGLLIIKPQFLVALPLILFFAMAWKPLLGLLLSAFAQLAWARVYFGSAAIKSYVEFLRDARHWIASAEPGLAPIQMHSLRSFWTLLIPSPSIAFAIYVVSGIATIAIAARVWKSSSPLALRFSALTLAAVLVNPHLFIYDLVVLAPALLLLVDWGMAHPDHAGSRQVLALSYFAFLLPLFGPLSRWAHLQLSVIALAALLCTLLRCPTRRHKLASTEVGVV
jgi:hypothetical protein